MDNQNQDKSLKEKLYGVLESVYAVSTAFLLGVVVGLMVAFCSAIPLFLTNLQTLADAIRIVHPSW